MDGVREFLESVRRSGRAKGRLLGALNIAIGRRISRADGTVLSSGITWRELAALLKQLRWDVNAVRELGLDPDELPPRDRIRFWYTAISHAQVFSAAAIKAGDTLAAEVADLGFVIGPAPGS